jgi:hypothetical protein
MMKRCLSWECRICAADTWPSRLYAPAYAVIPFEVRAVAIGFRSPAAKFLQAPVPYTICLHPFCFPERTAAMDRPAEKFRGPSIFVKRNSFPGE